MFVVGNSMRFFGAMRMMKKKDKRCGRQLRQLGKEDGEEEKRCVKR